MTTFGADILDVPVLLHGRPRARRHADLISRTGYTGELGHELYLHDASRDGLELWDALIEAGEPTACR